jgi:hypothetical protein
MHADLEGERLAAGVYAHGQDRDDAALAELQLGRPARLHEGAGHPQVLQLCTPEQHIYYIQSKIQIHRYMRQAPPGTPPVRAAPRGKDWYDIYVLKPTEYSPCRAKKTGEKDRQRRGEGEGDSR